MLESALRRSHEPLGEAHLWFLESLDRVNRAIQATQGTHDLDRVVHDVLDVVLDLFGSDRAWVAFPCDPEAPSWRSVMERSRPEYPGVGSKSDSLPMDPDTASIVRLMRESDGPIMFGLPPSPPLSESFVRRFGVQALIATAVHPRVGKPWAFGLHECARNRAWTVAEIELFREIGRRLADSLTSLIAFRDLREGAERLRLAVKASDVGLWDWNLVTNESVFSREYKRQLGYEDHEIGSHEIEWATRVHPDDLASTQANLEAFIANGATEHATEYRLRHRDGSWRWFYSRGELFRDEHGRPVRMLGCHLDITDRRRADEQRQAHMRFLESMDRVNRAIQGAGDFEQLVGDVLDAAVATFGCDCAYVAHPYDPDAGGWRVLAERASPEHRGTLGGHSGIAMAAESAGRFHLLRQSDGPVSFGPGGRHPLPPDASRRGIQSLIAMAIYPHADEPYEFGLHECKAPRVWTGDDERLLQEIGRRLADGLANRFVLRSLRASEGRFRTFVDHATDAFFLHDRSGVILDVNQQACDSLGYTRDELVGMRPDEIGVDTDFLTRLGPRLGLDEVIDFDSRHRRKDGATFPVEVRLRPFTQDGKRFAVALVRDITARKEAERALVESHSVLNAVVEGAAGAVFVKDLDGRYQMINSAGAHLFGLTVNQVIGRRDQDLFPPDAAEEIVGRDRAVLESGRSETIEETASMRGMVRTFLTTRAAYRDPMGEIVGLVGFSREVTDLKRLEQQLRQSQKMEAIGQLAGGVAHDFNNLLTAIMGFGEMAFNSLDPLDPNRELLGEIRRAGQRAANLTRQLLAFGRKQVLRPEVASLNALLADELTLLRRLISEDIEVTLMPDEGLGLARIDVGQFEQAIINLAVNARDAMPQGGSLLISTANVELDESYTKRLEEVTPGPFVMVSVTDSGHGMDEAIRSRIFEPFFTTKPIGAGTGLGLAMVYGFVKQSGGHVDVYSEPGRGTTFKIFLPRVFDERVASQPVDEALAIPRGHETVLLVEDEEAVRTFTCRVLQTAGYRVLVASHGPEAIEVAGKHDGPIHLLATDLVMPRMSGLEVASQLTQTRAGIRVLLMSGYPNEAALRHGVPPGAALLQKPFNALALARSVRQVLDGR